MQKSSEASREYTPIGDMQLIGKRRDRKISVKPYGTFSDYVSFYFGPRSPMLYRIQTGREVEKREPKNIVYFVTKFALVQEHIYIFTDGHASHHLTAFYNDEANLDAVDWAAVNARYWKDDADNPDRERRKQAEFLVLEEVNLSSVLGLAVYDVSTQAIVKDKLEKAGLEMVVKVRRDWYY